MLSLWFCPLLSSPQASHRRDLAFTFAYSTCSTELLLEVIQPRVTDPDARQETHQGALITLPSSRFDESISLCLTASAASPNVLGLSQGQAEGCRKPAPDAQFVLPSPTLTPFSQIWICLSLLTRPRGGLSSSSSCSVLILRLFLFSFPT